MIKFCNAVFLLEGATLSDQNWVESRIEWTAETCSFRFEFTEDTPISEFFLEIEFSEKIALWRFLDYTWRKPGQERFVANTHSPKILQLASGKKVVSENTSGCWEYQPDSGRLRWYFYHPMLSPSMVFDHEDERHFLTKQVIKKGTIIQSGLISGNGGVEEWARSPLGFVPIVCFTDHSDFDTLANLKIQRKFFASLGIKVTKGFFLYDYTHKAETASFQSKDSRNELLDWTSEGHELAYHALSQSYRGEQSEREFAEFESPAGTHHVATYIDHGFHPYNYTKQELGNWASWYGHMWGKGVKLIWNYIDSGEGNLFTVNQLNPSGFTLDALSKSATYFRGRGVYRSRKTDLRNFLMYGVPENLLRTSKYLKGSVVALRSKPGLKSLGSLIGNLATFGGRMLNPETIKSIRKKRTEIFEVNRFGPVFFKACNQQDTEIQIFQTLAVRDYDIVFSAEGLERLQQEAGLMIAHTYFAFTGENHEGRLFKDESKELRPEAVAAFERLGEKIRAGQIWNPTLGELFGFFKKFESIHYRKEGENLKISGFDGITRSIE